MKEYKVDLKLRFLQELLVEMAGRVSKALGDAINAVRQEDKELAARIQHDDSLVDQMRTLVESDAVRLLITEAPYGTAMREVIASMKIVTSLERMGDIAAKFSALVDVCLPEEVTDTLLAMARKDLEMSQRVLVVLSRFDAKQARECAKEDDKVDLLRTQADMLIFDEEPKTREERISLYIADGLVKHLERFGDYITTICAWVVYLVEGEKPNLNT